MDWIKEQARDQGRKHLYKELRAKKFKNVSYKGRLTLDRQNNYRNNDLTGRC